NAQIMVFVIARPEMQAWLETMPRKQEQAFIELVMAKVFSLIHIALAGKMTLDVHLASLL
ncbi:hypothetical protein ACJX0J_015111, partial [Zea mays]